MDKRSVQDFVRNYSIETTIHQAEHVERFDGIVAPGTLLYIAHTPGMNLRDMAQLAARLRREGLEPVPHIAARRIENLFTLEDLLAQLAGEAGVKQVLIVAGDTTPEGQFDSTNQVLESGLLEKYKIRTIGVAGHPEGHRDVADAVLRDALRRKNAYGQSTGASIYIVTQFMFSADPLIAWERSHGADIGKLPVIAGLPGLATAQTLLKYALECGVGESVKAFAKHYANLTKLLTVSAPDKTIVALAQHKKQMPETQINGVHFFTFGGFKKTADWANKIVDGNFQLAEDGRLIVR
jgi:methylenetetrahydrofolate reductase (NADPH)